MRPTEIKERYEERIEAILNGIRETVKEELPEANVSEIWDQSDDDFAWAIYIDGISDPIDITFYIAESENWDGEVHGINFIIEGVSKGGHPVMGIIPYNYTDKVWVDRNDEEALEERFQLVENANVCEAAELIRRAQE